MSETFNALVLDDADGAPRAAIKPLDDSALPEGDVTVDVAYSTLNYKDGMVLNGLGKLVKHYPHVPGIDFAGTVARSEHPDYRAGDPVILTGWGVGERHWGGYAQRARVKGDWLVPLPDGLSLHRAMALGTAGFTAMLAILALEDHGVAPGAGDVLVTGASGGLGSVAVAVLARLGHTVAASSGHEANHPYLHDLGAHEIVHRDTLADASGKPLQKERWAGAVDTVGSTTLANVLAQLAYGGSAAACGLAGGADLPASVMPFLLRGVRLLGIDSVQCPRDRRRHAWQRLATDMPLDKLDAMSRTVGLGDVPELGSAILKGETTGRIVVDVNG